MEDANPPLQLQLHRAEESTKIIKGIDLLFLGVFEWMFSFLQQITCKKVVLFLCEISS